PEVPESVPMLLTTVPVVMKLVQSMSSSMTPVRRYGNPAYEYEKRGPPDPTAVQSYSETVYPRPIHQLSEITESAYPEYPLSQHKYHVCPTPE
ncbi:hypothetical protein Tco_0274433, partial [Tanacetum coccineum]